MNQSAILSGGVEVKCTYHAKTAQNGDESTRRVDKSPRVDEITNETHDKTSTSDIDPSRRESREVHATGNRVLHKISSNLRDEKAHASEETARARGGVVIVFEQELQDGDRVPDQPSVHVVDGACGKRTKCGANRDGQRARDELMHDRSPTCFGEACPV
jgi:type I site-specific restriction endonuclease